MVIQHIRGRLAAEKGFPSSVYVTPIEQYTTKSRFYLPSDGAQNAFITLVAPIATSTTVKIDGIVQATGWVDLHQASVYRVLEKSISTGQIIVEHTGGVGVFVYAERSTCAYAFPAHMNVINYDEVRHFTSTTRALL